MTAAEKRDLAYEGIIGRQFEAFVDRSAFPPIEVRRYPGMPVANGPICDVWVTWGMSDVAMTGDDGEPIRRELIFYTLPGGNFVQPLVSVARFPFEEKVALDHSHSIQMYGAFFLPGGAAALVSEDGPTLPHIVLLSPLLRHHQRLPQELVIGGCPVEFLWVVPISRAELIYKKEEGIDALLDVFEENQHPWLFDPDRESYIDE